MYVHAQAAIRFRKNKKSRDKERADEVPCLRKGPYYALLYSRAYNPPYKTPFN